MCYSWFVHIYVPYMEKIVWGQDLIQPHQTNFQHAIVSSPALTWSSVIQISSLIPTSFNVQLKVPALYMEQDIISYWYVTWPNLWSLTRPNPEMVLVSFEHHLNRVKVPALYIEQDIYVACLMYRMTTQKSFQPHSGLLGITQKSQPYI